MEKINLKCDVCCCTHNIEGCRCGKECIKITTGSQSDSAHYCEDFEE